MSTIGQSVAPETADRLNSGLFFVLLLAVGITVAIVYSKGIEEHPKSRQVESDFKSFDSALAMYRLNAGHYPSTGQGLMALVTKPTGDPVPRRWVQVMPKVPPDPWGNPYVYRFPGRADPEKPEIVCAGADGRAGTMDDLVHQVSR